MQTSLAGQPHIGLPEHTPDLPDDKGARAARPIENCFIVGEREHRDVMIATDVMPARVELGEAHRHIALQQAIAFRILVGDPISEIDHCIEASAVDLCDKLLQQRQR
ncbi:MAG: hypothetical protein E6848_22365, partial [Bradyrhizobium sp.]|nr:hypothetical protein [Bradyrhizobium sp.]